MSCLPRLAILLFVVFASFIAGLIAGVIAESNTGYVARLPWEG